MNYQLSITPMCDYLHVRATGTLNHDNVLEAWCRIVKACDEHQCYNVLGEQNMDNPLSVMDAWGHQNILAEAGVTHKMRIAWVDLNPITISMTRFAETVLLNRGLANGRLFNNVTDAKTWLLGTVA